MKIEFKDAEKNPPRKYPYMATMKTLGGNLTILALYEVCNPSYLDENVSCLILNSPVPDHFPPGSVFNFDKDCLIPFPAGSQVIFTQE